MRPLRRPLLSFDLVDEGNALRRERGWYDTGHSAKTLVKHRDLRIVLIAMKHGTVMKNQQSAGSMSIQVLSGQLRVRVGQRTFDVVRGSLLALDRALAHDVEALEDTTCVLSVCANPGKRRA